MPSDIPLSPAISTALTPQYTPGANNVLPILAEYIRQLEEDPLVLMK